MTVLHVETAGAATGDSAVDVDATAVEVAAETQKERPRPPPVKPGGTQAPRSVFPSARPLYPFELPFDDDYASVFYTNRPADASDDASVDHTTPASI